MSFIIKKDKDNVQQSKGNEEERKRAKYFVSFEKALDSTDLSLTEIKKIVDKLTEYSQTDNPTIEEGFKLVVQNSFPLMEDEDKKTFVSKTLNETNLDSEFISSAVADFDADSIKRKREKEDQELTKQIRKEIEQNSKQQMVEEEPFRKGKAEGRKREELRKYRETNMSAQSQQIKKDSDKRERNRYFGMTRDEYKSLDPNEQVQVQRDYNNSEAKVNYRRAEREARRGNVEGAQLYKRQAVNKQLARNNRVIARNISETSGNNNDYEAENKQLIDENNELKRRLKELETNNDKDRKKKIK